MGILRSSARSGFAGLYARSGIRPQRGRLRPLHSFRHRRRYRGSSRTYEEPQFIVRAIRHPEYWKTKRRRSLSSGTFLFVLEKPSRFLRIVCSIPSMKNAECSACGRQRNTTWHTACIWACTLFSIEVRKAVVSLFPGEEYSISFAA